MAATRFEALQAVAAKPHERRYRPPYDAQLPVNWQKRIVAKIREVATDRYASNNNLPKLQGRDGYRLRVGNWRVITSCMTTTL